MVEITRAESSKAPKYTQHEAAPGVRISAGPFIGVVYNNVDPMRSGRLQVYIPELGGDPSKESSLRTVAYASPFFGSTPPKQDPETGLFLTREGQNFETNPHSYGMWMVPPDLGTKVLCMFVNGDPFKGYWFACIPDWPNMHMVPAIAKPAEGGNDPVVDYNQDVPNAVGNIENFYKNAKTPHDKLKEQYQKQGLSQDSDRGPITSSAFRETPSAVFGISTPGRKLSEEGNKDGGAVDKSGKGRKGGHSIVMDDGDEKGKSQLMRFRTAGGHQIMMNDSGGFIYITNQAGTAWLDMDDAGNINIWCKGQFNVKADGPIQMESGAAIKIKGKSSVDILADGNANLTGKGGVNINSDKLTKVNGKDGLHLKGKNTYLTGDDCVQINGGKHMDMTAGCITINSKQATKAQAASSASGPSGMPTKEPWSGHKKSSTGSGTSVPGAGSSGSATFSKAADYTNGVDINSGPIGQTGGAGPGPTGFRRGTESVGATAMGTGGGGSAGTGTSYVQSGDYKGYPELVGQPAVGSGQCVALVQTVSDAGHTSGWRPASNQTLFDNPPPPGAAIATLDKGYYANKPTGNHAAIYLGQGQDSNGRYIVVQEQNVKRDAYGNRIISERKIYERDGGSDSNNAKAYRQIANAKNPEGVVVRNAPPPVKAGSTVKSGDSNPDVGVGTNVAAGDSNPNLDNISSVANDKQQVGYVPPDKEQQYRDELRGGNQSASDYGPPVIDNRSPAEIARQEKATLVDEINQGAVAAESRVAQNTEKLGALENDYQAGFIDKDAYESQRALYENSINRDVAAISEARQLTEQVSYSTLEENRARALAGNSDEYASTRLVTDDNTFGDSPIADNTAANYQTPTYDANGTFTGYVDTNTSFDRNDLTIPEPDYYSFSGEEVTAQIASEANMDNFNNISVDSVDPWSTAPNIVQDQAISNAYDDYGNPLGGSPETGASSGGGIGYTTGSETYGPAAPPSASESGRELGPGSNDPVTGPTPAAGEGGTGTPGAPTNTAPQSPAKPAC